MSLSASSLAASVSDTASVEAKSSPLVRVLERDQGQAGSQAEDSNSGGGLLRVRSHALFLNDVDIEQEVGEERIIVPKQISLASGSPDLQYDIGCCALQGVSSKMEDRVLTYDLSYHPHFTGCRRAVLVAVLDGHAGSGAVSYLEANLVRHVLEEVALQIGCPPVLEPPPNPQQQQQLVHNHNNHHNHHHNHNHNNHTNQSHQKHPRHSQLSQQPYQPPHARQHQQQQQQAVTPEEPMPRPLEQQEQEHLEASEEERQRQATMSGQRQAVRQQELQQPTANNGLQLPKAQQPPGQPDRHRVEPVTQRMVQEQAIEDYPNSVSRCTARATQSILSSTLASDRRATGDNVFIAPAPAPAPAPAWPAMTAAATAAAAAANSAVASATDVTTAVSAFSATGPAAEALEGRVTTPAEATPASSSLSLGVRTPGPVGSCDWDPADVASSYGFDEWAAEDDEDGEYDGDEDEVYGKGPWAPPLNHSAAAERRRSSLAAYDSGCGCQPPDPPAALRNALLRCERELMDQDCHSGTTALVALMLGGSLWLANVGDCRAVVCDDGEARQLTVDHKAGTGRPEATEAICGAALLERQRLLSLGVQLSSDGYLQVTAPDGSCSDIAVSRNLGCAHLKDRSSSGRGTWSHLYPAHHHPQHPHMHVQRPSNRGARLSASSGGGGCGGQVRISSCGTTTPGGSAAVAVGGAHPHPHPHRGRGTENMDSPQQQHKQRHQHQHHHASAPGSVSGALDDLAGIKAPSLQPGSSPHVHQHQHHHHHHHQHQHHHHHNMAHQKRPGHEDQLQHHQLVCGAGSSPASDISGGAQEPPWHLAQQQRRSSHSQVQKSREHVGSGGRFATRSDPSILTFSPPNNILQRQQQQQLQQSLHAAAIPTNSVLGLSFGDDRLCQDNLKGLHNNLAANRQNGHGTMNTEFSPLASYDDGCSVVATHGRGGGDSELADIPPLPPPPDLPRINTGVLGGAARLPAPQILQQQQRHQAHQGLSPRPPRPPSSGSSVFGCSRGGAGAGADQYSSPRLFQTPAASQVSAFDAATASPPFASCRWSDHQALTPMTDDFAEIPATTTPSSITAASTPNRPPVLLPAGDTGSGSKSGSRAGSRTPSGTGFGTAQLSGGLGHNPGLPPLPPSPPLGEGSSSGGGATGGSTGAGCVQMRPVAASTQQQLSYRISGGGSGARSNGQMREHCPLPVLPFCPLLGSGSSYCRLSPLEEGGSSSSGVEGISLNNGGMTAGDEDEGSPMRPRCFVTAAAAASDSCGFGGDGTDPNGREEIQDPPNAAADAAAASSGWSPASEEPGEKRGTEGTDTVLKTAVTFTSWTLNSAFIHTVPAELAATISAVATEGFQEPQPRTSRDCYYCPSAAASAPIADCTAGAGSRRRSSGVFGSGAALSEVSGGPGSSTAGVLIPDPDLFYYEMSQDSEFLICGCDGLWDVMRNGEACRYVRRWLTDGRSAGGAAEDLCRAALKLGSQDNISVVVIKFSGRPLVRAESSSRLRRAASEAQL